MPGCHPQGWCRPPPTFSDSGPQFSKVTAVSASPTSMPTFLFWHLAGTVTSTVAVRREQWGRNDDTLCVSSLNPTLEATLNSSKGQIHQGRKDEALGLGVMSAAQLTEAEAAK